MLNKYENFEDEAKKRELIDTKNDNSDQLDTSYGKFTVRFLWKITAPIFLLPGIFLFTKDPFLGVVLTIAGVFMVYITYFKKR